MLFLLRNCFRVVLCLVFLTIFTGSFSELSAQDACSSASQIVIPGGGYGLGTFNSAQVNISTATVEPGETFQPTIMAAGLTEKSIWYKFHLPTTRNVKITLAQPGTAIANGDVGFAVYRSGSCTPSGIYKFTATTVFSNSQNPCIEEGDYLVQVSANSSANGPVYVSLTIGDSTGAAYDHPETAHPFGILGNSGADVSFSLGCHSLEDATEVCSGISNSSEYTQSTWHTFTTPAYFDYLSLGLGDQFCTPFSAEFQTLGLRIYRGDAVTTPMGSLIPVGGCDSIKTDGYSPGYRIYRCGEFQPNTTYSIQIFYKKGMTASVTLRAFAVGTAATFAPQAILSAIPASNRLGTLLASPPGTPTTATDNLGCNSRHSLHPCNNALPGIIEAFGLNYNLSTFYTFQLSTTSSIDFSATSNCGYPLLLRLFSQALSNSCSSLDTANLIEAFQSQRKINCLPPGNYTLQISGTDSIQTPWYCGYPGNCLLSNLGQPVNLSMFVTPVRSANNFSLSAGGKFDKMNASAGVMQPLQNGIVYNAVPDTIGCAKTVRPPVLESWPCTENSTTAIFREFRIGDGDGNGIGDSGIVTLNYYGYLYPFTLGYTLYSGDANALALTQGVNSYPDRISGLTQLTGCGYQVWGCQNVRACVTPGTYTIVALGDSNLIGYGENASTVQFDVIRTRHHSPATAQNLNNILDTMALNGGSVVSSGLDYFSCSDNAVTINGFAPPDWGYGPANKAIYRQFYLESPAIVSLCNVNFCETTGYIALFSGQATAGLSGLNVLQINGTQFTPYCISTPACSPLPAGWYTVVSYGYGSNYTNPMISPGSGSGHVGMTNSIDISVTLACPGPQFYRPGLASIDEGTGLPHLLQWAPRSGSTAAYPKTDTTYILPTENFNCSVQAPFPVNPAQGCGTDMNRIAFYSFRITQESYIAISTQGFWAQVYRGNARGVDSLSFASATPIQTCLSEDGFIELCRLQPGTYTLVIFAGDNNVSNGCGSVTPRIYIDGTGFSRFDHARRAYDFDVVPADNVYHSGKTGDFNPLNASRAPSNDFFYCTTGSTLTDPAEGTCGVLYNPEISGAVDNDLYNATNPPGDLSTMARRNLWYTFVVDRPGTIHVKVDNKTIGRTDHPYHFSIYSSDVDAGVPFSTVISGGMLDSTLTQGLTFVRHNLSGYYCYGTPEVTFYRDPCTSPVPQRYYIVVDNPGTWPYPHNMRANHQVEVSVKIDPSAATVPLFDHYYQAADLGVLPVGYTVGPSDNFTCATSDAHDPILAVNSCSPKTLWYKFEVNVSGTISYGQVFNSIPDYYNIDLFRQVIPGDSTINGLRHVPATSRYSDGNYLFASNCVARGTYYLMVSGCDRVDETIFPVIKIDEVAGDFCSAPVTIAVTAPGTLSAAAVVDCHTTGTDYGEFNQTLSCPIDAPTADYKTTWFRVDIPGPGNYDITTQLLNGTNAPTSSIKYRFMLGNCSAMQEQGCVNDGATIDTYECLAPGSYFIQVMTPITSGWSSTTGTVSLQIVAVPNTGTCAPAPQCIVTSSFSPQFDCNAGDSARFVNYSTYGSAITYLWDFGSGGQTSTAVSPSFKYPELATDRTYTVSLTVDNINPGCGVRTSTQTITIPGRPKVDLGRDTSLCNGQTSYTLNAATWPGSTYQWQDGSDQSTYTINGVGSQQYWVAATFNGCTKRDTVSVMLMPFSEKDESYSICNNDSVFIQSSRGWGETYRWNNGSTDYGIYASQPGTYVSEVSYGGCTVRDTFSINRVSGPFNNRDTIVCSPFNPFAIDATIAGGQIYSWSDGNWGPITNINSPGQYWVNISFGNCSVQDTLNVLTAPPPASTNLVMAGCTGQSVSLPWGQVVNASGLYTHSYANGNGCDSAIVNVTVTISGSVQTQTIDAAICAGQAYTLPSGLVVSAAGVYRDTLQSNAGCDSLYREVNLVVNNLSVGSEAISVCSRQLPYLWNGLTITAGGTHTATLLNSNNCDSVVTLTLNVVDEVFSSTDIALCSSSLPYTWNGNSYSAAGTYTASLTSAAGCDSTATLNLAVLSGSAGSESVSVCETLLPFTWNGNSYNSSGIYTATLANQAGCDSVATLTLTVNQIVTSETTVSICSSELPYSWNGNLYNAFGDYAVPLVSSSGCDSIATLHLLQLLNSAGTTDISICSTQLPYSWNGNSYSAAGVYTVTLINSAGCDSIATLNLSLNPPSSSNTDVAVCPAAMPYTWNGNVYVSAGSFQVTLTAANGCDSLATLNLSVSSTSTSNTTVEVCENQLPYGWNGNTYNAAGDYQVNLTGTSGCDSLAVLHLLVKGISQSLSAESVCARDLPFSWNGLSLNASGLYDVTLTNVAGCDSVARLNLVVIPAQSGTERIAVCGRDLPFSWNGSGYSAAGTYQASLTSAAGCDSVATLILSVIEPASSVTTVEVCAAQLPYRWNGNSYPVGGTYQATLVSAEGCDSVAVLHLNVSAILQSTTSVSVCSNALPYNWNGNAYSAAGTYQSNLISVGGCDSVAVLHLYVSAIPQSTTNVSVCSNAFPYLWNGNSYSSAGIYSVNLSTPAGCDSVATLNLSMLPALASTTEITVCSNQLPFAWNGNSYNVGGTYQVTLSGSLGCDSIATLQLNVNPVLNTEEIVSICSNLLPYVWNGNTYNAGGVYNATLRANSGCDSVVTLRLSVVNTTSSLNNVTVCSNQLPYLWNGNNYNSAGNYSITLVNNAGCDSITNLNLTVTPTSNSSTTISVCQGELPYLWNGNSYTSAGTYSVTLVSTSGCDSVATLQLILLPVSTSTTVRSICSGELPFLWNGNSYNSAGNYNVTLRGVNGCDSIARLDLTLKSSGTSITSVSVCEHDLPFVWNGNSYSSPGSYIVILTAPNGCDSSASLQLNVLRATSSVTRQTVCSSSLPLLWNGMNITVAGSYSAVLTNAAGCDSTAALELQVQTTPGLPAVNTPLTYCQGAETIPLFATASDASYILKWYTSASGGTGSVTAPRPSSAVAGTVSYYVEQVNGICAGPRSQVEVIINSRPSLGADKNISLCYGERLDLTSQYSVSSLSTSWSKNGSPVIDPEIAGESGTYRLVAINSSNCADTASVVLAIHPPVTANAGADLTVEYNVPFRLEGSGGGSYLWSPANLLSNNRVYNPQLRLTSDQEFYLQVTNTIGCSDFDTVKVKVLKGPGFYVPTAFTPNGDGLNDVFRPTAVGISKLEYFRVFNRYGELVFETSEINKGWDGLYKGVKQNIGNYVWALKGVDRNNREKAMNGYVVLIR